MSNFRRVYSAVCALAVAAILAPAAASAAMGPGVPPAKVPDELAAVAQLDLSALGIAKNSATASEGASAAAIDLPGLLTLGKAESTRDSSKVTVLSVGGQDLLVKDGDATGGHYNSPAAALGDVIDNLNKSMCPSGGTAGTDCVMLLFSRAGDATTTTTTSGPGAMGSTATTTTHNDIHQGAFKLLKLQSANSVDGIELTPVSATSAETSGQVVVTRGGDTLGTFPFGPQCSNVATALIATGTGDFEWLSFVGLANGIKVSSDAC